MWYSPSFGSYFSMYYWACKDDYEILKRLIKLEITRLISIPQKESVTSDGKPALDFLNDDKRPPLDFINRVIDVDILSKEIENDRILILLRLEWGDGKHWEDEINIYIKPEKEIIVHNDVYSALKGAIY